MDDQFYVYLPSNDPSFSDNKISNFRTLLAKPQSLRGNWEVALTHISCFKSWQTFTDSKCAIRSMFNLKRIDDVMFTIPGRVINSEEELVEYVNGEVATKFYTFEVANVSEPPQIKFNYKDHKFTMLTGYGSKHPCYVVQFFDSLGQIFAFKAYTTETDLYKLMNLKTFLTEQNGQYYEESENEHMSKRMKRNPLRGLYKVGPVKLKDSQGKLLINIYDNNSFRWYQGYKPLNERETSFTFIDDSNGLPVEYLEEKEIKHEMTEKVLLGQYVIDPFTKKFAKNNKKFTPVMIHNKLEYNFIKSLPNSDKTITLDELHKQFGANVKHVNPEHNSWIICTNDGECYFPMFTPRTFDTYIDVRNGSTIHELREFTSVSKLNQLKDNQYIINKYTRTFVRNPRNTHNFPQLAPTEEEALSWRVEPSDYEIKEFNLLVAEQKSHDFLFAKFSTLTVNVPMTTIFYFIKGVDVGRSTFVNTTLSPPAPIYTLEEHITYKMLQQLERGIYIIDPVTLRVVQNPLSYIWMKQKGQTLRKSVKIPENDKKETLRNARVKYPLLHNIQENQEGNHFKDLQFDGWKVRLITPAYIAQNKKIFVKQGFTNQWLIDDRYFEPLKNYEYLDAATRRHIPRLSEFALYTKLILDNDLKDYEKQDGVTAIAEPDITVAEIKEFDARIDTDETQIKSPGYYNMHINVYEIVHNTKVTFGQAVDKLSTPEKNGEGTQKVTKNGNISETKPAKPVFTIIDKNGENKITPKTDITKPALPNESKKENVNDTVFVDDAYDINKVILDETIQHINNLMLEDNQSSYVFEEIRETLINNTITNYQRWDFHSTHSVAIANLYRNIFIYCDIVMPSYIGSYYTKLLRIMDVPPHAKYGEHINKQFDKLYYIPLAASDFETIEVHIKDEFDQNVAFEFGTCIVTLHFRKIK